MANEFLTNRVLSSELLLHELQLDKQLSTSIHQERRADFSLMLAMLADDAREHSQFYLPREEQKPTLKQSNTALRMLFNLPKKAALSIESSEQIKQFNQAENIKDNQLTHVHFMNALTPLPLAFRDDVKHIESKIMHNTSLFCQSKHTQKNDDVLNKRLSMNVEGWLSAIQTSLVKSSLVKATA